MGTGEIKGKISDKELQATNMSIMSYKWSPLLDQYFALWFKINGKFST